MKCPITVSVLILASVSTTAWKWFPILPKFGARGTSPPPNTTPAVSSFSYPSRIGSPRQPSPLQQQPGNKRDIVDPLLNDQENAMISLFERARPSVVYISTFMQTFNPLQLNVMEVPNQTGSGFVWDAFGHVVTNYHVLGSAPLAQNDVQITFLNDDGFRETWRAKVRGVDADKDIAVLKLTEDTTDRRGRETSVRRPIRPISLGSSKNLRVGQFAIAIGNPFGLDQTLTTGVVSGLGRQVMSPTRKAIYNMIQTDAAINPGNSGGPLLDSSGQVIGMNTAIYSTSGASAGIGFAIPIDTMKVIVETIIQEGKVTRPSTGILFYNGPYQAQSLGVDRGLVVVSVVPGSPAANAGIRGISRNAFSSMTLGDIVISVDGVRVDSEADFLRAIDGNLIGDTITLGVLRYIDDSRTKEGSRRAVETTLKLKLARSPTSQR